MIEILTFVVASFAVWRISKVITDEEGPFSFMVRIRDQFSQGTWFGRGIRCLWCVSFWLGLVLGLYLKGLTDGGLLYGLAISSAAIFLDERGVRHE